MEKQTKAPKYWEGENFQKKFMNRLGLDCLTGAMAAMTVAPIMYTVDKAVVEKTAGLATLPQSVKNSLKTILRNPFKFLIRKDFLWIYLVYSSTYMTANSIDSACKITKTNDIVPKLIGVTAVNMTTSILKDRAFAYYFGSKTGNKKVTYVSMMFWLVRDVLTMAGAFVLPSRLSNYLQKKGVEKETSLNVSQFFCPVFFQFTLTPIHLMGYSIFENPAMTYGSRFWSILKIYPGACFIRMIRMGGAYGVGGVNNRGFRNYFIGRVEGEEWDDNY